MNKKWAVFGCVTWTILAIGTAIGGYSWPVWYQVILLVLLAFNSAIDWARESEPEEQS